MHGRVVSPEYSLLFYCFGEWKGIFLMASGLGTGMRNAPRRLMIPMQIFIKSLYL